MEISIGVVVVSGACVILFSLQRVKGAGGLWGETLLRLYSHSQFMLLPGGKRLE